MRAFIGLGGNLGDPRQAFVSAVRELEGIGQVVRVSSLYETAPRDLLDQPVFTNAALELEMDLLPGDLLSHLKRLEIALGREPSAERFGARTVDLDILAFEASLLVQREVVINVELCLLALPGTELRTLTPGPEMSGLMPPSTPDGPRLEKDAMLWLMSYAPTA